jgi:hypothetical protein
MNSYLHLHYQSQITISDFYNEIMFKAGVVYELDYEEIKTQYNILIFFFT